MAGCRSPPGPGVVILGKASPVLSTGSHRKLLPVADNKDLCPEREWVFLVADLSICCRLFLLYLEQCLARGDDGRNTEPPEQLWGPGPVLSILCPYQHLLSYPMC